MKKILPVLLLLMIATTAYSNNIDGTWKAKISGPEGDVELTYIFKTTDGKLTGTIQSVFGDSEISNTKINGNEFSFDISYPEMTITYNCTLNDDDTITAKVSGTPMGDSELILIRG